MENIIIVKNQKDISIYNKNNANEIGDFVQGLIDKAIEDQEKIKIDIRGIEKEKIIELMEKEKPNESIQESNKNQIRSTDQVLEILKNIEKSRAKKLGQIAKLTGIETIRLGEVLTRLYKTGRIKRIGKPYHYKYYMIGNKEIEEEEIREDIEIDPEKVFCKAKGRETYIEECIPNKSHTDCQDCEMLNQANE